MDPSSSKTNAKNKTIILSALLIITAILGIGICFAGEWPMYMQDVTHAGTVDSSINYSNAANLSAIWNITTLTEDAPYYSPIVTYSNQISNYVAIIGYHNITRGNGTVFFLNASSGATLSTYNCYDGILGAGAVANNILFIGCGNGGLHAINISNITNPTKIWINNLTSWTEVSPVVAFGVVYTASYAGNVTAINIANNQTVWSYGGLGTVTSSPAQGYGALYIGGANFGAANNMTALNVSHGGLLWNYTVSAMIESTPVLYNGKVYFTAGDNNIYALYGNNGSKAWNYTIGTANTQFFASPVIVNDVLYIGSFNNKTYALNATTGAHIWNYTTYGPVTFPAAHSGGVLFVADNTGILYAINTSNKVLLKSFNMTTGLSAPAVADNKVYVRKSGGGSLYVFSLNASEGGAPPAPAGDTTPPVTMASGTTMTASDMVSFYVTTNENAACKYSTSNVAYGSMTTMMTGSGTGHSMQVFGLTSGTQYTYYVRCQDTAGNNQTTSTTISFTTLSGGSGGQLMGCGKYVGNQTGCQADGNCTWTTQATDPFCQDPIGCCIGNNMMGGGGSGGVTGGCGSKDAKYFDCISDSNRCMWRANDKNQNPMCWIRSLVDAKKFNIFANGTDIGCCMQKGCDNYINTNASACTTGLGDGMCSWWNDTSCPEVQRIGSSGGCCASKPCFEFNETQCNISKNMGMSCSWNGASCSDQGFSGFNSQGDCTAKGGWWNASGNACTMPTGTSGGGGGPQMFGGWVSCRFASFQQSTCLNITGCVYCSNNATTINLQGKKGNISNSSSACYNQDQGLCLGHDDLPPLGSDINTSSLGCENIKFKTTCLCGPLPNCRWTNSSATNGSFCVVGIKTDSEKTLCQPPSDARFCDDSGPKFNQTLCELLSSSYMMPCYWNTNTTPNQCTFKKEMAFSGNAGPVGTFQDIGNEQACVASKGQWKTETYVESGIVKSKQFCDMAFGKGFDRCNNTCWACEFKDNGTDWENASVASLACNQSGLGYCQWTTDSNAANGYGWCDFPSEFNFGGGDCNSDCASCSYSNSPQTACTASPANCRWDSLKNACIKATARTCSMSCFECWSRDECANLGSGGAGNCSWDEASGICKITGFTGEVCFNGIDDDNDRQIDCADQDCSFDQFCGGKFMASCAQYTSAANCNNVTITSMSANCSWFTPPYGGASFCANPGEQCWAFKNNATGCNASSGCEWANESIGGRCDINETKMQPCFAAGNNQTACNLQAANCAWINDTYNSQNSRCEPIPFARCGMNQTRMNQTACEADGGCIWVSEAFASDGNQQPQGNGTMGGMMGGHCEPLCHNRNITNSSACSAAANYCQWQGAECRPRFFAGSVGGVSTGAGGPDSVDASFRTGCARYDTNSTLCTMNNVSCVWINSTTNIYGGFCSEKMVQEMFGGMMKQTSSGNMQMGSPPVILSSKSATAGIANHVNIREVGIKDEYKAFMFGIGIFNISDAALCNGYPLSIGGTGAGNQTAKFYWYLDTNNVDTDGCNASGRSANYTGFEFLIKYESAYSASTNYTETKAFYKCNNGTWTPTATLITPWRQMGCSMAGGAVIGIEKESLKKFSSYDMTKPLRIIVSTANSSGSYLAPQDSLGPAYYTPGTFDFKPECCECPGVDMDGDGINSDRDPDCKFFKKMGYVPKEDCMNGKDDNNDGLTDCADPMCAFTPKCGGSFGFAANASDKTAPLVTFSKTDTMPDGAFIMVDTNEPANLTVQFYYNDSNCVNTTFAYYKEVYDVGGPMSFDDFKSFHFAPVDNYYMNPQKLGYNLSNGTVYYYKIEICDPSSNCGVSSCLNFTTASAYSTFLAKIQPPSGFSMSIPALGVSGDNMSNSIPVNATQTKNINITINCPDAGYSITFVNVSFASTKSITLSNVTCNATSKLMGMPTSSWQKDIVTTLGSPQEILLTYNIPYANFSALQSCTDEGLNCTNVTTYANCTGNTTTTVCRVPITLGFSTYKVVTVAATTTTTTTSSSGGGGGGGGASAAAGLKKVSYSVINTGAATVIKDFDKDSGLKEIQITVRNKVQNVQITILKLSTKPASVTEPAKMTYKYIEINKTNVSETDLSEVKIKFEVNKTWLSTNGFATGDVSLYRYTTTWNKLTTALTGSDSNYYFYEATSPGMSYFAIGAEKAATTTKQACPNECCAGETNYLDKACASGFECTGGSCIETISAPVSTTCGNNLIEANEKCDGTALAGQSCSSMGYASGTLACKSNCQFDTSSCVASQGEQKQTEGLSLPKLPFDWVVLIIMFVIAIIIGIIYFKFFTKK